MMEKVPMTEALSDLWADMTGSQKWVTIALVLVVIAAVVGSWVNTFRTWQEVRVYERQAAEANRVKEEALKTAAKIATEIKVREEELTKVEVKRDAKKLEVENAKSDVARDRADYDRAVRERLRTVPSPDELCDRLAAIGYPCQPR